MCHGYSCDLGIIAVLSEADIGFINYLNKEQYYQSSRFTIANNIEVLKDILRDTAE